MFGVLVVGPWVLRGALRSLARGGSASTLGVVTGICAHWGGAILWSRCVGAVRFWVGAGD
jgi:hypothetical protein